MVPNGPETRAVAEVVQSMAAEAGFDLKIRSPSSRPRSSRPRRATSRLYVIGWSGRADPDGNSYIFQACKQPLNYGRLLRQGGRRAAQRGARHERPGRAQEGLRADRRESAEGPARSSTSTTATGCVALHRQARGLRSRCPTAWCAWSALKLKLSAAACSPSSTPAAAADHPDADLRVDADLRAAAAAAGRSGADHGGRGARSRRCSRICARSSTSTSRCRSATSTGSAACCTGDLGESLRIQQPVLDADRCRSCR